jgi:predicted ATPase
VREGTYPVQGVVRAKSVSLRLGFGGDDFSYAIDFGFPAGGGQGAFALDPEIKRECIWSGPVLRPAAMLTARSGSAVRVRGTDGSWQYIHEGLRPYDSMLSELADPQRAPDVLKLREQIRSWRFYDHVRTDAEAPARSSRIGTRTPVLSHDGSDLAAALQTIREVGDHEALDRAIDAAFPSSRVRVVDHGGRFELALHQHGLLRALGAAELSDGTLRYLLWVAALLTPRPPELLVLNEPETSLHPDLLAPLAQLIVTAAAKSQLIIVSHARPLIDAVRTLLERSEAGPPVNTIELTKVSGQTLIAGLNPLEEPSWHWPKR